MKISSNPNRTHNHANDMAGVKMHQGGAGGAKHVVVPHVSEPDHATKPQKFIPKVKPC